MLDDLQKAIKPDLNVQVTVWDPNNESVELTFDSYVAEASGLLFRIGPPNKSKAPSVLPLLDKGLVVGIVLETYPKPFIFYPIIAEVPKDPAQGIWLKILQNAEVEVFQRRKHVRIPMVLPFEITYSGLEKNSEIRMAARTCDVSGGGLRFTSSKIFSKEQKLGIHIQFDDDQPIMALKATVIFSKENLIRRHQDDLYSTACQFYDIDNAKEMILVRECFRRELKRKQQL